MHSAANEVLQAAMHLSADERSMIALQLTESLKGFASQELEIAWNEEVARRINEADHGGPPSIPAEQVFSNLRMGDTVIKNQSSLGQ
jgi:putative addiction module component (TIGR02574 family)